MLISTKRDKKSNTHNDYVKSIGIMVMKLGTAVEKLKIKTKQAIYIFTISPSKSFTRQKIAWCYLLVSHLCMDQLDFLI